MARPSEASVRRQFGERMAGRLSIRLSRWMATLALPARLPKCCCSPTPAKSVCCPHCPSVGREKALFRASRRHGDYTVDCTWQDGKVTSFRIRAGRNAKKHRGYGADQRRSKRECQRSVDRRTMRLESSPPRKRSPSQNHAGLFSRGCQKPAHFPEAGEMLKQPILNFVRDACSGERGPEQRHNLTCRPVAV